MTVPPILSAAWPLDVAIAAVIEAERARAGSLLETLLDTPAVYSGEARDAGGLLLPIASAYVVLGSSSENNAAGATFRRPKASNTVTLDIWTADTSKRVGALVYGELRRLMHRQPLTLADYGTVVGSLELVVSMPDPHRTAYHVQARYTVLSFPPRAT